MAAAAPASAAANDPAGALDDATRRRAALTQFLSLAGSSDPSTLAQRFLEDYDDGEGEPELSLTAGGWRSMMVQDRLSEDNLRELGVTEPRCLARLLRLTRPPPGGNNLEAWLQVSQCPELRPYFEEQGFLSLECVLESGLLAICEQRDSSLRGADLKALGLQMKQRKRVEKTLQQLLALATRAVPPLVLTDEMTPAERSATAERIADLLPQVGQLMRSPSQSNPTPTRPPAMQSPPLPAEAVNANTHSQQSEQQVLLMVPSPAAAAVPGASSAAAALQPVRSPDIPRSPLGATPAERVEALPTSKWRVVQEVEVQNGWYVRIRTESGFPSSNTHTLTLSLSLSLPPSLLS